MMATALGVACGDLLPPLYLEEAHYERLARLAGGGGGRGTPVARFLAAELARAHVCEPEAMPDDAAAVGAQVVFRVSSGPGRRSAVLAWPRPCPPARHQLTVLSPLGVALLGLRPGACMPFTAAGGIPALVRVEEVVRELSRAA